MEVFAFLLIALLMPQSNANTDYYDDYYDDFGDPFINIAKLYPQEAKPEPKTTTTTTTTVSPFKKGNRGYLPKECGVSATDRIIGGQETALGEYPWMALLKYIKVPGRGPPTFLCGGSLINERYVLTAAHCMKINEHKLIGVRLGEHDIDTPIDCVGRYRCAPKPIDVGFEDIILHYGWNGRTGSDDIALLRLDKDIQFTAYISPICLPMEKIDLENKVLYVAGWGRTEHGVPSPVMLKVAVPAVSPSACARIFGAFDETGKKQICAGGEKSKDSCAGDSGGPLMSMEKKYGDKRRVYQRGIVSFGDKKCGRARKPAVYTRVTPYLSWIMENIRP